MDETRWVEFHELCILLFCLYTYAYVNIFSVCGGEIDEYFFLLISTIIQLRKEMNNFQELLVFCIW